MAEPSTGALAVTGVVGSVTLGTAFPEIDLAALVGAFGGAFLFVIAADSMPAWRRVGYLFAGWIGGYFGAVRGWNRRVRITTLVPHHNSDHRD